MIHQMRLSVVVIALGTFPIKGTNAAKLAVFRRLSQLSADFRFSWEVQHFGGADFRRRQQETVNFRRKPHRRFLQKPMCLIHPKNPAVPKILRVVNVLPHCDLLSRRTLCGHHFPGNYRPFSPCKKGPQCSKYGGVAKTQRRSTSLFYCRRSIFSTAGSFE